MSIRAFLACPIFLKSRSTLEVAQPGVIIPPGEIVPGYGVIRPALKPCKRELKSK